MLQYHRLSLFRGKSANLLHETRSHRYAFCSFQAVVNGDVASMQRFFKLFPLINEHSSGITRFGNYLCQEIRKFAESNYKVFP